MTGRRREGREEERRKQGMTTKVRKRKYYEGKGRGEEKTKRRQARVVYEGSETKKMRADARNRRGEKRLTSGGMFDIADRDGMGSSQGE